MGRLHLRLLGGFEARLASGEPIELASKKAEALLAYLTLAPNKRHGRERLAGLLWGERDDEHARASLRKALTATAGVSGVEEVRGSLIVRAKVGALTPAKLATLAAKRKVKAELIDPWPVDVSDVERASPGPGVWFGGEKRVWVTKTLLDPTAIETQVGLRARDFEFEEISASPTGLRQFSAPLAIPHVLSVFPDLDGYRVRVVAGKDVDWKAVARSFESAGAVLEKKLEKKKED